MIRKCRNKAKKNQKAAMLQFLCDLACFVVCVGVALLVSQADRSELSLALLYLGVLVVGYGVIMALLEGRSTVAPEPLREKIVRPAAAAAVAHLIALTAVCLLRSFLSQSPDTSVPTVASVAACWSSVLLISVFRWLGARVPGKRAGAGACGVLSGTPMCGNVMVVGAGHAGRMTVHYIRTCCDPRQCRAVCLIDDDPAKAGEKIEGVEVRGTRDDIGRLAEQLKIDCIVFAAPSCRGRDRALILQRCFGTGRSVLAVSGTQEGAAPDAAPCFRRIRQVQVRELLNRETVAADSGMSASYLRDRVVLVTGGGGSIGSELCRQIAAAGPERLIIFDIYENNAYDIRNELRRRWPGLDVVALIGSVRDAGRLDAVFSKYRPQVVYHAAAHKHVPLMEDSPGEAVKNNIFGTLNAVRSAERYGAERFVLISTDKAVHPSSVMGGTKRVCEMIVQVHGRHSDTRFAVVRFGNVLESNGSVIPLFRQQIAEGGPVTVTHPDVVRYFMTIPEAVSLVLQAGEYARGGEIFVLDMGQPVRIAELAEKMIRLSGYEPGRDIRIEYTGLRPGEKLREQLFTEQEGLNATGNRRIYIGQSVPLDEQALLSGLEQLRNLVNDDRADIPAAVRALVSGCQGDRAGCKAESAAVSKKRPD